MAIIDPSTFGGAPPGTGQIVGTALVAALALLLAAIGRRWLPVGVPEGLYVAALSGLLAAASVASGGLAARRWPLAASLAGLALLWLIAAGWLKRAARQPSITPDAYRCAATVCALVAAAAAWSAGGAPERALGSWATSAPWALCLGAAGLAIVVVVGLRDWRRRVHLWRTAPSRLVERMPRYAYPHWLAIGLSLLAGAAGLCAARAAWSPIGLALAAIAASVVGHRWLSNGLGGLGLLLAAESVIAAAYTWLGPSWPAALLGWAAAGIWLLWLARFWRQQLDGGKPWTTTGRLIPLARRLGIILAGGGFVVAAAWVLEPRTVADSIWIAALAAIAVLLHLILLLRTASEQGIGRHGAALAACLAVVALLAPLCAIAAGLGWPDPPPPALLAAAALLLAVSAGGARRPPEVAWVYNAFVGGVVPVLVLYSLTWRGAWSGARAETAVALAAALLAMAWHWRIGRRRPAS